MIITKLMGGLGNQMFQYAMAKNYSLLHGIPLRIDTSYLEKRDRGTGFVYRDYELDLLSVDDPRWQSSDNCTTIREPHFHYSNQPYQRAEQILTANPGENIMFEGYWQTPKYFNKTVNLINDLFSHSDKVQDKSGIFEEIVNSITTTESVAIHVRRTDFLNTNFHGVVGIDYIEHAVETIKKQVKSPAFFIFSDDLDWCKSNIKIKNSVFVEIMFAGARAQYYIQLMQLCKHQIICNSTYSWWAAWLNNNPEKNIIAPKRWFVDTKINTNDLIPSTWSRI